MISLRVPNNDDEASIEAFRQEWSRLEETDSIPGASSLLGGNTRAWIEKCRKDSVRVETPERVLATTYLALDDDQLVGVLQLRHTLNEYLLASGGHIGYSVRPSKRRKGYATKMLSLGLAEAAERGIDRVLVTCDEGNFASEAVIRSNGGTLDTILNTPSGGRTMRFWIERDKRG